ncbi:MAG TPA: DUF5676 family membrane protein [Hyphomicrobiales bacterium]|nr:DUF5676 family membrane protein [Hyphomicrobiales bacterium]
MHKVGILSVGIALAITFAVLSALCAVATALWPDATIDFFGAFMHAIDLKAVKLAAPVSLGRVLYGVIGLGVVGFVAGIVFAAVYNAAAGER